MKNKILNALLFHSKLKMNSTANKYRATEEKKVATL